MKIIKTVPAYAPFEPIEMSWEQFRDSWIPDLAEKGMLIGVNWSGKFATGYDIDPERIKKAIEAHLEEP